MQTINQSPNNVIEIKDKILRKLSIVNRNKNPKERKKKSCQNKTNKRNCCCAINKSLDKKKNPNFNVY